MFRNIYNGSFSVGSGHGNGPPTLKLTNTLKVRSKYPRENSLVYVENMQRYRDHIEWISQVDLRRIKFLDEVHVVAKDVSRRHACGPCGERIVGGSRLLFACLIFVIVRGTHFAERYSLTTICRLPHRVFDATAPLEDPTYVQARIETNNANDFLDFVVSAIRDRFLVHGDILVLDNARIHSAEETAPVLDWILTLHGISIRFLPAYSPEVSLTSCNK